MSRSDPVEHLRTNCVACGASSMPSGDISRRFGINFRQLDYLAVQLGWTGMGPHGYRRWSTPEIAAIAAFTACTENGLRRGIALDAARTALQRAQISLAITGLPGQTYPASLLSGSRLDEDA